MHIRAPNLTATLIDNLMATCQSPAAIEEIVLSIRNKLDESGYVVVAGRLMRQLLICNGAADDELQEMEEGKLHDSMARDVLPSMTHRTLEGETWFYAFC